MAPIDTQSGFEICIKCLPDGTFNVSAEPLDPAEESAESEPGIGAQSIDQALQAAQEIYGQVSGGAEQTDPAAEDAAMQDGFSSMRGGR